MDNYSSVITIITVANFIRFLLKMDDVFMYEMCLHLPKIKRLRWSRSSVVAFSTQVRGFKPGRSRRIFMGGKILSAPSFGGEVKPSVPCRRFAACKRSLKCSVEVVHLRQNCRPCFSPAVVPPFAARGLLGNTDKQADWWRKVGTIRTIRVVQQAFKAAVNLGHMPWALTTVTVPKIK